MRSYSLLLAIFGIFIFSGCKKTETQETLEAYIKRAGITDATKDPRGFYYKIVTEGTGVNPNVNSKITIFYKGTFTNGSIFDQTGATPRTFTLNQLIFGWQYGIPLIKAGGKILLYIPPELGYGSFDRNGIPGNSVLIFEVELVSVG